MSRPLRIEYPGALYHVMARGNARQPIFLDRTDRLRILRVFDHVRDRFRVVFHGHCLMDNHYHLVLETPEGNLSRAMRQLNGVYSQSFNRRHDRVGHLFQGRYKSVLVEKDNHLLELARYVVLNPVREGLVERPEDWEWSSYRATVGLAPCPTFLTIDDLLGFFGSNRSTARRRFRTFIEQSIESGAGCEPPSPPVLGSKAFAEASRRLAPRISDSSEIPMRERHFTRPSLEEMFGVFVSRSDRNRLIVEAHCSHGYSMKEIADASGLHRSTISRIVGSAGSGVRS